MKKNLIVIIIVLAFFSCTNNSPLFESMHWKQAIQLAKEQNKIVFVDVCNSKMNNSRINKDSILTTIIKDSDISKLIKEKVILVRADMSKPDSKEFIPKLQMLMYPCYLFLNEKGEQLTFTNIYQLQKDRELFKKKINEALNKSRVKKKNSKTIKFENLTWTQALEQAKQENKLIFIDLYTSWCRPCLQMQNDVFTLNKVADFYNANFINIKLKADTGVGAHIAKKYLVKGYPTFLFIDCKEELIFKSDGFSEADKFIGFGKSALSKKQ